MVSGIIILSRYVLGANQKYILSMVLKCNMCKEKERKGTCLGFYKHYIGRKMVNMNDDLGFDALIELMDSRSETFQDECNTKSTIPLGWKSIINFPKGYAFTSKYFLKSIYNRGIDVRYEYAYGPGTPFEAEEPRVSEDKLIQKILDKPFINDNIQVVYGQGDVFYKNTGKYQIGFTMLETSGIPAEWVRQCNEMDEVWVPSAFNVQTFKDSGVKVPIQIVPLGIDLKYFYRADRVKQNAQNKKYVFLSVFEWVNRKAPELLLQAFDRAFTDRDDVVLICKITNADPSVNIKHEIEKMGLKSTGGKIEIFENLNLTSSEMAELYRHADCFLLPTHGEGWGMPILEAMACGLPVIATGWSAQMDFFNSDIGYPIDVKALIDADHLNPYYNGFKWALPDEEHFVHLMRYVYEHREDAKEKGRLASEEVRSKWTWNNAANVIFNRIKDVVL